MFSPVVIRASHLARPADDKEQTMNDTFGRTCGKQFATYDPDTRSWRMWPDTGLWGSIEFSETWPRTGSMRSGRVYERPTSAPHTTGSGCSFSLPTPKDRDYKGTNSPGGHARNSPDLSEISAYLPTITASDADRERNNPAQANRKSPPISAVSQYFPTPVTTDAKGARNATANRKPGSLHHTGVTLTDAVTPLDPSARTAKIELNGASTDPLFDVGSV